jgi:peptidyl-prolyl cis-trans isomerase D
MISWIQKYFQFHFRVIFAVLLGVVIIAFVFTIGAAPGIGGAERGMVDRPFFDYNLSLQSDQQRLMGDASLSASLRVGAFGQLDGDQVQNYAFQRAAALHLAALWHLPPASTAEVTAQLKTLRAFAGPDGQFDPKTYQTFRDNLKTNPRGLTEGDILRVVSDDVRVEKVQNLLAGPGYVLPGDVRTQLLRTDTKWTLATGTVDYAAFKPTITPGDSELAQFFEQSGGRYDIPPQVSLGVVEFPALEQMAKVNLTEAEVRAFYDASPSRFPKPADPAKKDAPSPSVTPPADPAADFAAVRAQVESTLRFERAVKLAQKAASDLSLALFESKARTPEAVQAFLTSRQLNAKPLAPFSRDAAPAELGGSPEAIAEAFRLGKDRPASDALSTRMGALILVWKESLPTRKPLFTEVKAQVSTDYAEGERRKKFIELGRKVKADLETRLKAGATLEQAAPAAGQTHGLTLTAKALPAFDLRSRPQDVDFAVLGTLERLQKGQLSDMVFSGEQGLFVYAVDQQAPETTEANPRFAETRAQIAGFTSRIGGSSALAELVEKELKRGEPKMP